MAFVPLATVADLTALNVDITGKEVLADSLLASVSEAVREAAGVPITRESSTVSFGTEASRRIELPARPVVSVESVALDGVALTAGVDYVLRDGHLWRLDGMWHQHGAVPSELTVAFTHGFAAVPADIVKLVCTFVAAGLNEAEDGAASTRGVSSERIDDYQVSFTRGDDEVVDLTELPERTRRMLRARFSGGGPSVVGTVK